jgi:hypothetical protein
MQELFFLHAHAGHAACMPQKPSGMPFTCRACRMHAGTFIWACGMPSCMHAACHWHAGTLRHATGMPHACRMHAGTFLHAIFEAFFSQISRFWGQQ